MSLIYKYQSQDKNTSGLWAVVSLKDGMTFEGLVLNEAPHGIYISIGGNEERLSLFPWTEVFRVVYRDV